MPAKVKKSLNTIFMERTKHIYRHQEERAAKLGVALDYSRDELRAFVKHRLGVAPGCYYCGSLLNELNFSFDHKQPVSRGGTFLLDNLCCCCESCNLAKHDLTESEYAQLLNVICTWTEEARKRFLARLRFGGNAFRPKRKS